MRENRTCGSEGGEAQSLPYPYQLGAPSCTWLGMPAWAHGSADLYLAGNARMGIPPKHGLTPNLPFLAS